MVQTRSKPKDPVLKKFENGGVYIRMLDCSTNEYYELRSLDINAEILDSQKITKAEELKPYFELTDDWAPLLDQFKFRPATHIVKECVVSAYEERGFGVIIDPRPDPVLCPHTFTTHWFKENIASSRIATGRLSLTKPYGIKDLESLENSHKKLQEYQSRRKGEEWDPYNRAFGMYQFNNNENLQTYDPLAIMGIVFCGAPNIKKAIEFREFLYEKTKKIINFYHYRLGELTLLPEKLVKESVVNNKLIVTAKKPVYNDLPKKDCDQLFHLDELVHIKSSLAKFPPSRKHPIVYEFDFLQDEKQKKGKAYIDKEGWGVICVNKHKFFERYQITRQIAEEHQVRLLKTCNELLQNENVKKKLGVNSILLERHRFSEWMSKIQFHIRLSYSPLSSEHFDDKVLLKLMGYPAECKFKHITKEKLTHENSVIKLAVLQALDPMVKALTSLAEESCEPVVKRARRK